MIKVRLDKLVVDSGLVNSRERAQGLILAGRVLVNEQKVTKAGAPVAADALLRILGEQLPYVSRGGLKLRGALDRWSLNLSGRCCIDIGASTGGFSDCMLQAGAAAVVAVDTGAGQMAVPLRDDPRLWLLERTNARLLSPSALLQAARSLTGSLTAPDFFAMDVSFIGASLVLPAVIAALVDAPARWAGEGIVLVKPQFEAGREWVGKGGIVRDSAAYDIAVDKVGGTVVQQGGRVVDVAESPITGAEGNREFLLYCQF